MGSCKGWWWGWTFSSSFEIIYKEDSSFIETWDTSTTFSIGTADFTGEYIYFALDQSEISCILKVIGSIPELEAKDCNLA